MIDDETVVDKRPGRSVISVSGLRPMQTSGTIFLDNSNKNASYLSLGEINDQKSKNSLKTLNYSLCLKYYKLNRTYDTFRLPRPQKNGALPIMQMPLDTRENYSIMTTYSRNAHFITTSSLKLE